MNQYKFVILHGTMGNPNENWIPWLKSNLEELGHTVETPTLPTPGGQELLIWLKMYEHSNLPLDENTVLIGHSAGATFIVDLLEHYDLEHPIKAAFLVSGFAQKLNNKYDWLLTSFVEKDFDWEKIKKNVEKIVMLNGDNDPYIPNEIATDLAKNLEVETTFIKEGGHLNATAGYLEFPLLLEKIKTTLNI